jgi:hypothetical protein
VANCLELLKWLVNFWKNTMFWRLESK